MGAEGYVQVWDCSEASGETARGTTRPQDSHPLHIFLIYFSAQLLHSADPFLCSLVNRYVTGEHASLTYMWVIFPGIYKLYFQPYKSFGSLTVSNFSFLFLWLKYWDEWHNCVCTPDLLRYSRWTKFTESTHMARHLPVLSKIHKEVGRSLASTFDRST